MGSNSLVSLLLSLLPGCTLFLQLTRDATCRSSSTRPTASSFAIRSCANCVSSVWIVTLRLLKKLLSVFPCRDLLPQGLPSSVELVGAGPVIMVDDGDWNLAVTDNVATVWKWGDDGGW